MVSSLQEVDCLTRDTVHQPVFLADTTRPAACQHISERLGLSHPLEWIPHHCFDQIQDSDCGAAFGLDPITEVLPELTLKGRDPLRISLHLNDYRLKPVDSYATESRRPRNILYRYLVIQITWYLRS